MSPPSTGIANDLSMTEKELDRAFADALKNSTSFQRWLLSRTGYADVADDCRLLWSHQQDARPDVLAEAWYRHWWCRLGDGRESETDILALFERVSSRVRFALHIENKPAHGKFTARQVENYPARARYMSDDARLKYSEWRTVLVAPQRFLRENDSVCAAFDYGVAHEDVGAFVPEFAAAARLAAAATF